MKTKHYFYRAASLAAASMLSGHAISIESLPSVTVLGALLYHLANHQIGLVPRSVNHYLPVCADEKISGVIVRAIHSTKK